MNGPTSLRRKKTSPVIDAMARRVAPGPVHVLLNTNLDCDSAKHLGSFSGDREE